VARHHRQQVLRLAGSLRQSERAQRLGSRDFWLEEWEKQAIVGFHLKNPLQGYRRLGKIERWHKSLKGECIRPGTPLSLDDARRLVSGYVQHYNNIRLNSATSYIAPRTCWRGDNRRSTRSATRS